MRKFQNVISQSLNFLNFFAADLRSFETSRNARKLDHRLESSVIVEPIFEGEQHFSAFEEPKRKYPLTPPQIKYRIGIISDLDKESESMTEHGKWDSYLKEGNLILQQSSDDPSRSNVFFFCRALTILLSHLCMHKYAFF